jgi:hypothetical protein
MYVCMYVCILHLCQKRKKQKKRDMQDSLGTKGMATIRSSVPGIGTGGMLLSQMPLDETSRRQDLPSYLQKLGNVPDR